MMALKNTDQSPERFTDRQMEAIDEKVLDQPPFIESSVSLPSLERKPSLGEDPAAMTIQFLRARLLSERSISKAARQRAHHLAKKVSELERQLELEIQLRKKAEAITLDALAKYYGDVVRECSEEVAPYPRKEDFDKKNEYQKAGPENIWSRSKNNGVEGISEHESINIESSRQLNYEEDDNKDNGKGIKGNTESPLLQKGCLAWETQSGVRKQQDVDLRQSSKRLGRNSCIKTGTFAGTGKSVRQIRNKVNRLASEEENKAAFGFSSEDVGTPTESSSQEEYSRLDQKGWVDYMVKFLESSSIQDSPSIGGNGVSISDRPQNSTLETGHESSHSAEVNGKNVVTMEPSHETKGEVSFDNEMERDMEKVLERQAELIEKYKAEENAQRAWEEKYREQSLSVSTDIGQDCSNLQQLKERGSVTSNTNGEESTREGMPFQPVDDADKGVGHRSREPGILEESLRIERTLIVNNCKVHDSSEDIQGKKHTKTAEGKAIAQPCHSDSTILENKNSGQENIAIPDGEVCSHSKGIVNRTKAFQSENRSSLVKGEDTSHSKNETVEKSTQTDGTVLEGQMKCQNQTEIVERKPHESELHHSGMSLSHDSKTSIRTGIDMTQERTGIHLASSHSTEISPDLTGKTIHNEPEHFNRTTVEEGGHSKLEHTAGDETGSHSKRLSSSFKFDVYADYLNGEADSQELFISRDSIKDHLASLGKQVLEGQVGLGSPKIPQVDFSFVQPKPAMDRDTTVQGMNERTGGQANVGTSQFSEGRRAGSDGASVSNRDVSGGNTVQHEMQEISYSRKLFSDQAAVSDTFIDMREAYARNNLQVPWLEKTGLVDRNVNHNSPGLNGMGNSPVTGLHDTHHEKRGQADQLNHSPWEEALRRRIRASEIERERHRPFGSFNNYPRFPSPYEVDFHQEQLPYAAAFAGGRKSEFPFQDPAKRASSSEHYNQWHDGVGGYVWQDTTMAGRHRSVDGDFDNVMKVLNALQLAKCQIQSSGEQVPLSAHTDATYRNRCQSRGQFLAQSYGLSPGSSGPSDHPAEVVPGSVPYTRVTHFMSERGPKASAAHVASSSRHPPGSGKETSHNQYFPTEDPLRMQHMFAMADTDYRFLGKMHHHSR